MAYWFHYSLFTIHYSLILGGSKILNPIEIAQLATLILDEKKARDIVVLKTFDVTVLADYFIIATAGSVRQIKALADELADRVAEAGEPALRPVRKQDNNTWMLIDFGSVIVHIFTEETRQFYDLERLWGDATPVKVNKGKFV
jgi:ribosome-associated protein